MSRAVGSGYLFSAVGLIAGLVVTPVLARRLGPTEFGVWSVAFAAVSYLEVLELGFGGATIAFVSERAATDRSRDVREAVATSFWVLVIPGVVAMILGLVGAALAPHVLNVAPSDVTSTRILAVILAADVALSIPSDTFGGVLAAFQRLDIVNLSLTVSLATQSIAWIVVLASGGGITALAVVTGVTGLGGQLSRYVLARRVAGPLPLHPRLIRRSLFTGMTRLSGWLAVTDVNRIVAQRLDVVIVGTVAGVVPAGIYAVGQKLTSIIIRISDPLTLVLFPLAARSLARRDRPELADALTKSLRAITGLSVPFATSLALFAGPLVELWVGNRYAGVREIVVLLSCAFTVGGIATANQQVLKGLRDVRLAGLTSTLEAGLNIALSIALGLRYGASGVAVATLVSSCVSMVIVVPAALRRCGLPVAGFVLQRLREHVPPLALGLVIGLAMRHADPRPGVRVLIEATVVFGVHLLAHLLLATTSADRRALVVRVRSAVGR